MTLTAASVSTVMFLVVLMPRPSLSQQGEGAPRLAVFPLSEAIDLDGRLDEPIWLRADSISNLTTTEPVEGGSPNGGTVVRVLADESTIVIGLVAHDPDPRGIVSFSKQRDPALNSEDHILIVLDTFLDGRSGYTFAVNPTGARYDALVSGQGESQSADWDAVWEASTAIGDWGWSAEIRIPLRSLSFGAGLNEWGFNVQRRVQRLQEVSRWASPRLDYQPTQTARAGRITGLPEFDLGIGVSVRPAVVTSAGVPELDASAETTLDPSLDVTQRIGSNVLASATFNTDFAETEVDTRRTNLTRFPLFFPEKRTFFLEGADIFDFGFGLGRDLVPFFSRRLGLVSGSPVPLEVGGKLNGRIGNTNFGALTVRTGDEQGVAPAATMGVARIEQNVLQESSVGVIGTFGDPTGIQGSWLTGADFTYRTSSFRGNKNLVIGAWGMTMNRDGLAGDRSAFGAIVDYPNDL